MMQSTLRTGLGFASLAILFCIGAVTPVAAQHQQRPLNTASTSTSASASLSALDRFQAGLIEPRLPFLRQAAVFQESSGDSSCIEETSLQFTVPALSSLMGPTAHRRPPPCLTQKSCAIIRPIQPENGLASGAGENYSSQTALHHDGFRVDSTAATPETADSMPSTQSTTPAHSTTPTQPRTYSTTVTTTATATTFDQQASSHVTRQEMHRRVPRSAPDALRYEPGVFVQQTAHAQGSAFVRGMTGQQTLLLFDGIRLNNSTYRQGPNQYFFTLDSQSIDSISVVRGGASTRYGSDALGGVISSVPIIPKLHTQQDGMWLTLQPSLLSKLASADKERGARVQLHMTLGDNLAFFGGVGTRRIDLLEAGGVVYNPSDSRKPTVPRFAADQRTQLGTGFDEMSADAHLLWQISAQHRLRVAAYTYRQFDAPRTDHCPAPYAPYNECLSYDEQFRDLAYAIWDGHVGTALVSDLHTSVSWQTQHERRSYTRPSSYVTNIGRDNVYSLGLSSVAHSSYARPTSWARLRAHAGIDVYHDWLESAAWITFDDIDATLQRSRGQYLDASRYLYGGAFVEAEAMLWYRLHVDAGTRLSWVSATAPADPESGTQGIDRNWFPLVGHAGLRWQFLPALAAIVRADRSFRAPNLDDLSSRQQTGPGFQFENPELDPEVATTFDLGMRLRGDAIIELWFFYTLLENAVGKSPMSDLQCPANTPQCQNSWSRFQLVNARSDSYILGVEGFTQLRLPYGLGLRAAFAWTWGQGPRLDDEVDSALQHSVPLSRVPPLNGSFELLWSANPRLNFSSGVRWASEQNRLAIADLSDARIPVGGTPGFIVVDLRAAYKLGKDFKLALVLENLFDAAYRYHGSSVNGPGRGILVSVDAAAFFSH